MIESSLIKVKSNTSLTETIAVMSDESQNSLSNCVVVMDGFKLVGIVTDWDIVQLVGRDVLLHQLTMADLFEALPIALLAKDISDPFFALSLLQQSNSRHLPILGEDGSLLGLVTPARIHRALKPSNLLKLRPVSTLMTDQVVHADLNTSALRLAQLMTDYQATSVVIVAARKQVERDIRIALTKEKELNELKTRFISMASHEFRTPLTTILASAESLERYQFKWTDDKKRSTLQRIQTAVKYMTDLLNDVLVFGKGEAGKLEFKPEPLKLDQFCADLIEEFQFKENNPQRLLFSQSGDSTDVWVDKKLLRHILVNLLANALKYSPPETSVRLELACRDGTATFQVQDAGIGIPTHEQKRLFDSFYRATNVGTIPGTGLGLAIVMRAVKAHGGTIAVASEAGAGTTFTVSLPITQ